jgi:hypothetical protein
MNSRSEKCLQRGLRNQGRSPTDHTFNDLLKLLPGWGLSNKDWKAAACRSDE